MTAAGSRVRPLANIGVLVTRPVEQSVRLIGCLWDLGAEAISFPALAIVDTPPNEALSERLASIGQYDRVLFVSPSAVQFGLAALQQVSPAAVTQINTAAVGASTAAALRMAGCRNIVVPEQGADSEHLLALPEFADLNGQRVLIFRGEGGRELIAETLRARGAQVDYAACYRRVCPTSEPAPLHAALAQRRIQAVTVFSAETLDNLLRLGGEATAAALRALPLFVPHIRIAAHARALHFAQPIATAAGESGVLAGLVEYFRHD
jgi:uroporphyrinogen-III synthase